jgi:hypothetical protein
MGYDNLGAIRSLEDTEIKSICSALRKPGGLVPNSANAGTFMPDPGTNVSPMAERNLMLLAFWLKHLARVSRTAEVNKIDVDMLNEWIEQRKFEATWTIPTDNKPKIDTKDWHRTLENIRNYLTLCPGETKIPLAYIVRDRAEVEDEATDLTEDYQTIHQEMISRAPHGTPVYKIDNAKVHGILRGLCETSKEAIVAIHPAEANCDGRAAYLHLFNRYLGRNASLSLSTKAENVLSSLKYSGETSRFNFARFVQESKTQHQVLESLELQGLHKGIDEASKVRHFLNSIAGNRQLESVKTQILSTPTLRENFEECIRLAQDVLDASGPGNTPYRSRYNVSSVSAQGDTGIESRYYSKEEYAKLTTDQRQALYELRKKRGLAGKKKGGKDTGRGGGGGDSKGKGQLKTLKRRIAALKTKLADASKNGKAAATDDSEVSSDEEVPMKSPAKKHSNASNSALTRQS